MAAFFCDTSALVKRSVAETGSGWFQGLVHPQAGHDIYIARITAVEVCAAIARRQRGGTIASGAAAAALARFRADLVHEYAVLEIVAPLLAHAMQLAENLGLRGYDAVQLAAAIQVNSQWLAVGQAGVTLLSADQGLNNAAIAEGLAADDPNQHP